VQERASVLAQRIRREAATPPEQIRRAFVLCFSRPPDATEMKLAAEYLQRARALGDENPSGESRIWSAFCQSLLASAEFRNID
jgi:hypothetical protein